MTSITLWTRQHDDRGAVAVTVAILFMVFILLAALVVDVGYWYNVRRQLQSAADAAALAGCWEVIKSGDHTLALNAARTYVTKNAVAPADGAVMIEPGSVNTATGHSYTEITDDWVKVSVKKQAPGFFARVLGYTDGWIIAQSRADAAWMQGMRGTVPFSLPVIDMPKKVTVRVNGGPEIELFESGGKWRASGLAVSGAARASAYPLNFTVYNKYNVATPLVTPPSPNNALGVIVRESTAPFTDVWLSDYVVTERNEVTVDPGIDVHIASSRKPDSATFDGTTYNKATDFTGSNGNWILHVPSPATDELSESFPLALKWGNGNGNNGNNYTLDPAAWVIARRSGFPIDNVDYGPKVISSGGTINVELELNKFKYDTPYAMKVVASGPEVGNFCAVRLDQISHWNADGTPQSSYEYDPSRDDPDYKSPAYEHYLEFQFPFEIHIGDYIWTETGAMPQPTSKALLARFAGDADRTWAQWNTAGRPPTKRLVYVPLVEKYEETSGRSHLRVVAIASFYVEPAADYRNWVMGYFVEYVAGGQGGSTPPPSGLGIQTPRLVSTGLDF